jgi:hypothetical protein
MLNDWRLRRWTGMCLGAVVLGVIVLSLLDCTEADRPLYLPVPDRNFSLVDSVYSVVEADTTVYVRVKRSCGCDSAWVWVSCSSGSATPGEDFVAATTQLGFHRGSAVESLAVHILADTVSESPEEVLISLGLASASYGVADPDTAVLTIVDDDTASITPGPHFAFARAHCGLEHGHGHHRDALLHGQRVPRELGLSHTARLRA